MPEALLGSAETKHNLYPIRQSRGRRYACYKSHGKSLNPVLTLPSLLMLGSRVQKSISSNVRFFLVIDVGDVVFQ